MPLSINDCILATNKTHIALYFLPNLNPNILL